MNVMSILLGAMVGSFITIVIELIGLWYFVFKRLNVMEVMDYENKYKEALGFIEKVYRCSNDPDEKKRIEEIFPELAGSESERIKTFLHHTFTAQYLCKDKLGKQVEQKPVPVWSKEDENQYINTIGLVKNANDCAGILDKGTALNWLKSLKGRYTWKPSEEQLNALRVAIGDEQGSDCCGALRDLLKDLKSL